MFYGHIQKYIFLNELANLEVLDVWLCRTELIFLFSLRVNGTQIRLIEQILPDIFFICANQSNQFYLRSILFRNRTNRKVSQSIARSHTEAFEIWGNLTDLFYQRSIPKSAIANPFLVYAQSYTDFLDTLLFLLKMKYLLCF